MNDNLRKALQVIAILAILASIIVMRDEEPITPPSDAIPEEVPEKEEPTPNVHFDELAPAAGEKSEPVEAVTTARPERGQIAVRPGIPVAGEDAALLPPLVLEKGEQGWEAQIRYILETPNITESEKGKRLLALMPTLPVQGRETATEEAIRRLRDEDYGSVRNVVTSPATYPLAQAVLWQDLMQRPKEISLPTLLTIARNPEHPYAEAAVDNLDYLVGKNYGRDWARWDAAVREKLAAPPTPPRP